MTDGNKIVGERTCTWLMVHLTLLFIREGGAELLLDFSISGIVTEKESVHIWDRVRQFFFL